MRQLNKHVVGKACALVMRVGSNWPTRRVGRGATCAVETLAGTNIGFVVYLSGQPARGFQMGLRHFRGGGFVANVSNVCAGRYRHRTK